MAKAKHFVNPGESFKALTVLSPLSWGKPAIDRPRHRGVMCRCSCGKHIYVTPFDLVRGIRASCGCYATYKKPGYGNRHLQMIWWHMKSRCANPKHPNFHRYGGRGITICDEWLLDPTRFFEWAAQSGYEPTLSIERVDNNKGYSPDNCTWIPRIEQMRNRCNTILVRFEDKNYTIAELAQHPVCVVCRGTLGHRIRKGWAIFDAVTTPAKPSGFHVTPQPCRDTNLGNIELAPSSSWR